MSESGEEVSMRQVERTLLDKYNQIASTVDMKRTSVVDDGGGASGRECQIR